MKRIISSFRAVILSKHQTLQEHGAHRLQAVKALDVIEASFARVLQILHTPASDSQINHASAPVRCHGQPRTVLMCVCWSKNYAEHASAG